MKKKLLYVMAVVVMGILILCSCESTNSFKKSDTDNQIGITEEFQGIEENYVGSVNSDKYHYPQCRWAKKIKAENEIWFSSTKDAMDEDYVPCNTCNP